MAQTWVLNESMPETLIAVGFGINFTSNGRSCTNLSISKETNNIIITYLSDGIILTVYNSSNTPAWTDPAYRTITLEIDPGGRPLDWLQANATQQLLCDANDMSAVADAIRTKAGSTATLAFPDGFVSAVNGIQTGGGGVVWYAPIN